MKAPTLRITASRLARGVYQIAYGHKIVGTVPVGVESLAVEVGKLLGQRGILEGVRFAILITGSDEVPILGKVVEPAAKPVAAAPKNRPQVRGWRDDDLPTYRGSDQPEYVQHTWHEGRKRT